jgi:hypothetical protein
VHAAALQRKKHVHVPGRVIARLPGSANSTTHGARLLDIVSRGMFNVCGSYNYILCQVSTWERQASANPVLTKKVSPSNSSQPAWLAFISASRYPADWMPIVLTREHLATGTVVEGPPGRPHAQAKL